MNALSLLPRLVIERRFTARAAGVGRRRINSRLAGLERQQAVQVAIVVCVGRCRGIRPRRAGRAAAGVARP
jgi:hypothetical protein